MKIDLRKIPTVVLGLEDEVQRNTHMTALCQRLGLDMHFVRGERCKPGFVGCALAHIRAVGYSGFKAPFLLLENDVDVTEAFTHEIDVPDGTDALYLGLSNCGLVGPVDGRAYQQMALLSGYDDTYARVHNMMGAHAILFLNDRFASAYVKASQDITFNQFRPHDVALTGLQQTNTVLATRKPFFFQTDRLQNKMGMQRMTSSDAQLRKDGDKINVTIRKKAYNLVVRDIGNGVLDWRAQE